MIDLTNLLVVIIVFGMLAWLIQSVIPMSEPFRRAAVVVLVITMIVWLVDGLHAGHLRLFIK